LITAFAICNNVTPVPDDPDMEHALDVFQGDKLHKSVIPEDNQALLEVERVGAKGSKGSSELRNSLEVSKGKKLSKGPKMVL